MIRLERKLGRGFKKWYKKDREVKERPQKQDNKEAKAE